MTLTPEARRSSVLSPSASHDITPISKFPDFVPLLMRLDLRYIFMAYI